jgi:hypothetical protein
MIEFARFDSNGRYIAMVIGDKEGMKFEDLTRVYIGKVNLQTQYHDMTTGLPADKGPQPSKFHEFDYVTKQWVDPRTVQDHKNAKWKEIKMKRDALEVGGFVWDGSKFDSDPFSQSRIQGAVQLATITGTSFTIDWTLSDNTIRTLNVVDMISVGAALGQHVNSCHERARTLRQQIDAATDVTEIELIAW